MTGWRWLCIGAFMFLGLGLAIGFWPHHDAYYACGSAFNPERKVVGLDPLVVYDNWHPCRSAHRVAQLATAVTIGVAAALAVAAWAHRKPRPADQASGHSHEVDGASR
jgi:hypothetical protein